MTTHRLPEPGSDNGTWGAVLNDFLSQAHAADGSLLPNIVGANQIQDGTVTAAKLAGNIPASKFDSATQAQLNNVGTIPDGSITTAKIASGGIAPSAVTGTAVVTADSRLSDQRTPTDGSVTDAKIASGGLTNAALSPTAAIAKTKLASGVQTSLTAADSSVQTVNTKAPTSGAVTLTAGDVGAPLKPTAGADGKVLKWNNTSGLLEDASVTLSATYVAVGSFAFSVKDYGAKGDGSTDDTTAIQQAIAAAHTANGGTVFFPRGTYITATQTLYSYVHFRGEGISATIIKLKSGTNADLLLGNNALALLGGSSTGGIANWSIQDLTLDGNQAGQSSGTSYCIRHYGYGFILQNLRVLNGRSGGIYSDWNGGSGAGVGDDQMEAQLSNVKVHNCSGIGLEWYGPHDSQWSNTLVFSTTSHNAYIGPNSQGTLGSSCHFWGAQVGNQAVALLVEADGCQFSSSVAEGSDVSQLVILANDFIWSGGNIYGSLSFPASAVQMGQQAGITPYNKSSFQGSGVTAAVMPVHCMFQSLISSCVGTNGAVWFANPGENNVYDFNINQQSGNVYGGILPVSSSIDWMAYPQSGGSNQPLVALSGQLIGKFSPVQPVSNGGQVLSQGYTNSLVSTTGNVTGVILQQASYDGAILWVVNTTNFTITFAASGTSHVADGTTAAIPAFCSRGFVYIYATGMWYRVA